MLQWGSFSLDLPVMCAERSGAGRRNIFTGGGTLEALSRRPVIAASALNHSGAKILTVTKQ